MSLEFIDGFDHYTTITRKWDSTSNVGINASTGRFGGGCLDQFSGGQACITPAGMLSNQQTRVVGFAYYGNGMGLNAALCQLYDTGTLQVDLRLNSSGQFYVTRNGTTISSLSAAYPGSIWYYLEFKVKIDPTVGTYELRVNGVTVLSGTNANTRNTANSYSNQVRLSPSSINISTGRIDDLYILNTLGATNNDFLGECRILTVLPNGDGATVQWALSTGSTHFGTVDENPPNDDTDYNSSSTVGQIDLLTFPAVSPTGLIAGVQSNQTSRKDDAGTRQTVEQCRSGGTVYTGPTIQTMQSSYAMFREIREVDPATGVPWTTAGLNAAQFGIKLVV